MKIGFPNNPWKDVISEMEWIAKNSFDFADVFLEYPLMPGNINSLKIRKILDHHGLGAVGHLAWYLPIGHPERAIRETAVIEAESYFPVFEKIGIKKVTVHANWAREIPIGDCIHFQSNTLRNLVRAGKPYGISIMYEHIDGPNDSIENVRKILDSVPGLLFHLDIGHANLFGRNPEDFIKAFSKKLAHVHLHDNNGKYDQHLPIGKGIIKWASIIKTLKESYDETITLEIFSGSKESILISRKRLIDIWKRS